MKLLNWLEVFRKGSMVADPKVWKDRAGVTMLLAGLIMAAVQLAKAYGYELPVDEETATLIAGGIAAVVGVLSTYATSDKVGILPAKPPVEVSAGSGPADPAASDVHGKP